MEALCIGGPKNGAIIDEYATEATGYYLYHRWYEQHEGPRLLLIFKELIHGSKAPKLPRPSRKKAPKPEVPVIDMERAI